MVGTRQLKNCLTYWEYTPISETKQQKTKTRKFNLLFIIRRIEIKIEQTKPISCSFYI